MRLMEPVKHVNWSFYDKIKGSQRKTIFPKGSTLDISMGPE